MENIARRKILGIGGIFFKARDPQALMKWYAENLGLDTNDFGCIFSFGKPDQASEKGYMVWSPFEAGTDYFAPSEKEFMINYRVENIEDWVLELKNNGVIILDEIDDNEFGKFVHILDIENNKIELWEPKE